MATKAKEERYIEAVGRRKTAIARVRITPAARSIILALAPLETDLGNCRN